MNAPDLTCEHPDPGAKNWFKEHVNMTVFHGTTSMILHHLYDTNGRLMSAPRLILKGIVPLWGEGDCMDAVSVTKDLDEALTYADRGFQELQEFDMDEEMSYADKCADFVYDPCSPSSPEKRQHRIKAFLKHRGEYLKALDENQKRDLTDKINAAYPIVMGFDSHTIGDFIPLKKDLDEYAVHKEIDLNSAHIRYIGMPEKYLKPALRILVNYIDIKSTRLKKIDHRLNFFK